MKLEMLKGDNPKLIFNDATKDILFLYKTKHIPTVNPYKVAGLK